MFNCSDFVDYIGPGAVRLAAASQFTGMPLKLKKKKYPLSIIIQNFGIRRAAEQLVIYKHDRGFELGFTERQLQLSSQSDN